MTKGKRKEMRSVIICLRMDDEIRRRCAQSISPLPSPTNETDQVIAFKSTSWKI